MPRAKEHDASSQLVTFQRWWNSYLEPRGLPVTDLLSQIGDGYLGFRLLEALEGLPAAPVQRGKAKIMGVSVVAKPAVLMQKMDNLNNLLEVLMTTKGVKLVNIGPTDLAEGNETLVLGLTWELIKFYELSGTTAPGGGNGPAAAGSNWSHVPEGAEEAEEGSGVAGLMKWAQGLAGVESVSIGSWTGGFTDGRAFAAIIHAAQPGILDYEATKSMSDEARLTAVFDAAHDTLGVPLLLREAEVAAGSIDQLSIVTYVSKLRQRLSEAGTRLQEAKEAEDAVAKAAKEAAEAEQAAEDAKVVEAAAKAAEQEQEQAQAQAQAAAAAAAECAIEEAELALAKAAAEREAADKAGSEAKAVDQLATAERAALAFDPSAFAGGEEDKVAAEKAVEDAKAAAERAAAEKAVAEKAVAEKEEALTTLTSEKTEAAKTAEAAKAAEDAAAEKAVDLARAAGRARKMVAAKRRISMETAAAAADALKAAAEAAAHEEAKAARAAKAAAAAAAAEDATPEAAAKEEEAKEALATRRATVKRLSVAVVAAEAAVNAAALIQAEDMAETLVAAKIAQQEPPTFNHLAEPEPPPDPEDSTLIVLPEMPKATDPTANWDDFEQVVVNLAKATPGVLHTALCTTVSVGGQYVLHPAPTRMVKKAASGVGAFSEPVTKPVLEVSTVLVKAVSDSAVKAYPHVKAGTIGVTQVAIDKSKSAVEFMLPHLKTGGEKALQVSGQALEGTGGAIMSTPIGDKVVKPIDEKVVQPVNEKVIKPVNEKVIKPLSENVVIPAAEWTARTVSDVMEKTGQAIEEWASNDEHNEAVRKHNEAVLLRLEEKAAEAEEKAAKLKDKEERRAKGEQVSDDEPDESEEALVLPMKLPPSRMVRARKANQAKGRLARVPSRAFAPSLTPEEEELIHIEKASDGAVHYVAPSLESSEQVLEEHAAVAVAVAATTLAQPTAIPVIVPTEYEDLDVIVRKADLGTRMGVVVATVEDDAHPVVAAVSDDGACADAACQIQNELMVGDRIVSIAALSSVVRMDTAVDCKGDATATSAMLKKSIGNVKISIERGGIVETVEVHKPTQDSKLGIELISRPDWRHPKVGQLNEGSLAAGALKVDDVVLAVEAATEDAKVEIRYSEHTHLVATGFLKSAIGPVTIHVHRMRDAKRRLASVLSVAKLASPSDLRTTDTDMHTPHEVTSEAPEMGSPDRRASRVLCAPNDQALREAEAALNEPERPCEEESGGVTSMVSTQLMKKTVVMQLSDGVVMGAELVGKGIEVTGETTKKVSDFLQRPFLLKRGSSTIAETKPELKDAVAAQRAIEKLTVVVNKEEASAKLGVTLTSNAGDAYPVVSVLASGGACATKACQLQGKLMEGDKIASVKGFTHVVHLDTEAAFSAVPTAQLLKKAVGLIRCTVERTHEGSGLVETLVVCLEKKSADELLGIELVSAPGDKHPKIKSVVDRYTKGSAAGKLVPGDVLLAVSTATAEEEIGTVAVVSADGHPASIVALFLATCLGPITIEVLRFADKEKRRKSAKAIYMGQGVVLHDSDDAPGVGTTIIAASDVGAAGQAGKLQHEELEAVCLGGLTAGSGRDGGGCMV